MSTQSGINVSQELIQTFSNSTNSIGSIRLITVKIQNESLVTGITLAPNQEQNEIKDFELLESILEEHQPIYILYRLGDQTDGKWILISYVPDSSKVRDKMLHASSRSTLLRQLGDSNFEKTLFVSSKEELTPIGYQNYLDSQNVKVPMTQREKELNEIKLNEGLDSISMGTNLRSSNLWGSSSSTVLNNNVSLGLVWSDDALIALSNWCQNTRGHWVQFFIQPNTETIVLSSIGTSTQLKFPDDQPSYTFYDLENVHQLPGIVFIYACPSKSPIRSRLLYSSSSSSVSLKPTEFGIKIHKRIETSEPDEIDENFLKIELNISNDQHQQQQSKSQEVEFNLTTNVKNPSDSILKPNNGFSKPSRPGRRN